MPEASIIITAQDKYLVAVKAMSKVTKSFSKDQEALERTMLRLTGRKNKLSREFNNVTQTARILEAAYAATGNEAMRLEAASERLKLDNIQREFSLVTRNAQAAQKQMEQTGQAIQKTSALGVRGTGGMADVIQAVATSGLGQMGVQLIQNSTTALGTSAFGEDTGTMVSSGLSSMASGAIAGMVALGPFLTPVIGAAIGAAIGGVVGLFNGAIKNFEKQDDYFKAYYNGILDEQAETKAKDIETGSSIAAGREVAALAFRKDFGNMDAAKEHVTGLTKISLGTAMSYDELAAMSKTMAGQGVGSEEILSTLKAVGAAGTVLELDADAVNAMVAALGQMKTSDTVTAEQLQALDNLGIDATGLLAEKKGMSAEEASQAVAQGEISGSEAAELLRKAMTEKYNGSMTDEMKTFSGLTSALEGWKQEMQNAYGEGYNETRKEGMQKEITAYSGAMGEKRMELNTISGSLAAHRENLQEQYKREAVSAVLAGGGLSDIWDAEQAEELNKMSANYQMLQLQYEQGDQEAGLKMARLEEQAEAMGKLAYDNSDWAKTELTAEEQVTSVLSPVKTNWNRSHLSLMEAAAHKSC